MAEGENSGDAADGDEIMELLYCKNSIGMALLLGIVAAAEE